MFRVLTKSGSGSCGRGCLPRRRHESVLRVSLSGSLHGSSPIRITRCVCVFARRRPGAATRHVFASRPCRRTIAAARMSGTAAKCFRFPTGRPNKTIRSWSGWRRGVRPSAATAKVTHKEQIKAAARRYRETNKEKISEYARHKWRTDPDHREKHRVRTRRSQRKMVFKRVYGISLEDYDVMFERQGGACAICKRTGVTLCVDHCHLTGEVRGLLCIRCNSAIGFCGDDPAVLLAAAEYLQAARDRKKAQDSAVAGTDATPESMAGVPIPNERDTR